MCVEVGAKPAKLGSFTSQAHPMSTEAAEPDHWLHSMLDANMPRINHGMVSLGACLIAAI